MTIQSYWAPAQASDNANEIAVFNVGTCVETGCGADVVRGPCERGPARCSNCRAKRVEAVLTKRRLNKLVPA